MEAISVTRSDKSYMNKSILGHSIAYKPEPAFCSPLLGSMYAHVRHLPFFSLVTLAFCLIMAILLVRDVCGGKIHWYPVQVLRRCLIWLDKAMHGGKNTK